MHAPQIPVDEDRRVEALVELAILDTPPEEVFDRCLGIAAEVCGVSHCAVSLVDRERQWFKAAFGRLPKETPRAISFCGHAVAHDDVLVVNDAALDPRFSDNPLVTAPGGVRFYAGVPLHGRDGQPIGTLCVLSEAPHELSKAQLDALRMIAEHLESFLTVRLVALRMAARANEERSERAVLEALEARRRETTQMLVHDLKNPLAVVSLIGKFAQSQALPAPVAELLKELVASADVAERMVCDILDVASSEHGSLRTTFEDMDLPKVVASIARRVGYLAGERGQTIELDDGLADPIVRGDSTLLGRALRNFLDNAVTYGPPNTRIGMVLRDVDGSVELRVEDEGPGVPDDLREAVFEPFVKLGDGKRGRPSHGLGLALCAQVAHAHGGKAWVEDGAGGTGNAFCLRFPRR